MTRDAFPPPTRAIERCMAPGCEWSALYQLRPTDDTNPAAPVLLLCEDHATPYLDLPTLRGVG